MVATQLDLLRSQTMIKRRAIACVGGKHDNPIFALSFMINRPLIILSTTAESYLCLFVPNVTQKTRIIVRFVKNAKPHWFIILVLIVVMIHLFLRLTVKNLSLIHISEPTRPY